MTQPYAHVIDEEHLHDLYAVALTVGGKGLPAPPRDGCLAGALGNAWTAELYRQDEEFERAGLLFAVYLFVYLLRAHCFIDGNKRVAWLALVDVLAYYRAEPNCERNDVVRLCDDILTPGSDVDADDVLEWLLPRLRPISVD
jgi:death on curing protein